MKIGILLLTMQVILFYILMFFWVYQLFICIFAFIHEKKKEKIIEKNHKFMAVVSARNEENVIGNLIESLKEQTYRYVDIYVIADNCNDKTAEVARLHRATVYERFDKNKRSKGFALEWFFEKILSEKPNEYDAFCIFDADNIVSNDFFEKMNTKLCEGEKIVQGYRDISNPGDTWISANYAIFYWTMNRCYHYTRYKLGLSPLINGTGFMVSMDILKEKNGWHSDTLTEDIEFSIENIIKNHKIGWAQDAVVYDEQPLKFKQSFRQRLRWSVGHLQCFQKFIHEFLTLGKFNATIIDTLIYTFGMPMILLSVIITIIDIIKVLFIRQFNYTTLIGGLKFTALTIFISMLQALIITILEKKSVKKVWKGIATYPIFLVSWFVINIMAFFNKNLEWKPITHLGSGNVKEAS